MENTKKKKLSFLSTCVLIIICINFKSVIKLIWFILTSYWIIPFLISLAIYLLVMYFFGKKK